MRINSCQFIGRLVADPTYTAAAGDTSSRCSFRIGVNRVKSEKSDFINCVVWGAYADVCAQYLKKGKEVAIEGELRTQSTKDEQGNWSNFWSIQCSNVSFGRDSQKNQTTKSSTKESVDEVAARLAAKVKGEVLPTKSDEEILVDALIKQGLTAAQAKAVAAEEFASKKSEATTAKTTTTVSDVDPFSI